MTRAGLLVVAVAVIGCHPRAPWSASSVDPEAIRLTASGPVIGARDRAGGHAWLGIPFAAPPTGALRFRAPRPAAPWTALREAITARGPCTQLAGDKPGHPPTKVIGSEDCLYLDVYAPALPRARVATARLPVMVWIHGGGNSIGRAADVDGGWLAAREDVVVVAIDYRLGPLGWLRHPALRAETSDPREQSGNFGTLDQLAALAWVRANAAAFGGDPDNVTIFGESAGGLDVVALLVSPLAQGLFHRAIVESGGLSPTTPDDAELPAARGGHVHSSAELVATLIADRDHVARPEALARAAAMPAAELRTWLRALPAATLFRAEAGDALGPMIMIPAQLHDGVVLPAEPFLDRFASGQWNQVPVIFGSNLDEAKTFEILDPFFVKRDGLLGLAPRDPVFYELTSAYLSRAWKVVAVDEPAAAIARGGGRAWAYRFDWRGEGAVAGVDLHALLGAGHAVEVGFVFGGAARGGKLLAGDAAQHAELSHAMMDYWGQFAHAGDPGRGRRGDLPAWSAWSEAATDAPRFLALDAPRARIAMRATPELRATLLDALAADPHLDRLGRCRIYRELAVFRLLVSPATFPTIDGGACADLDYAKFPWADLR